MKFLKKLKSSNFWVSMISAVVLILQAVFNVEIKTEYLNQIIMAILGLLVMSGIVSDGSNNEMTVSQNVDVDNIKDNVTNIFAQVASNFETSLVNLIKQFEMEEEPSSNVVEKENVEQLENATSEVVVNEEQIPSTNQTIQSIVANEIHTQAETNLAPKVNSDDIL